MSQQQTNRIAYWDNLKAFLIFTVVLGHFLIDVKFEGKVINSLFDYIYIFHMPAFVLVSGYFSKSYIKKGAPQVGKLFGFLILFVIFKVALWVEQMALSGKLTKLDLIETSNAPWYLFALFIWFLLLPVFVKLGRNKAIIGTILFSILMPINEGVGYTFSSSRIIIFLMFFVIGYYLDYELIDRLKTTLLKIVSIIYLLALAVFVYFNLDLFEKFGPILYASHSYSAIKTSLWVALVAKVIWIVVVTITILAVMILCPKNKLFFTYVGRGTLSVFIIHLLIRDFMRKYKWYETIGHNQYYLMIATVIISLIICFIFSEKHIVKLFNCAFKIVKPKGEKDE